jgi:hypothetical protein
MISTTMISTTTSHPAIRIDLAGLIIPFHAATETASAATKAAADKKKADKKKSGKK